MTERDVDPSSREEILALGNPINTSSDKSEDKPEIIILEKIGFVLSYNKMSSTPVWVCECLTKLQGIIKKCSRKDAKTLGKFEIDSDVNSELTLADYRGWSDKYQKGHLAAAANHKYNVKAYGNTFLHSNCVPMFHKVNKIMSGLEKQARAIAFAKGKVYIITMPYFIEMKPEHMRKLGSVPVPDAIVKIIVQEGNKDPNKYFVNVYFVKNSADGVKAMIEFKDLEHLGWKFLSEIPVKNIIDGYNTKFLCIETEDLLAFIKPVSNNPSDASNPEVDDNPVLSNNVADAGNLEVDDHVSNNLEVVDDHVSNNLEVVDKDNHPKRRIIRNRGQ